jgi:hypothetical protein
MLNDRTGSVACQHSFLLQYLLSGTPTDQVLHSTWSNHWQGEMVCSCSQDIPTSQTDPYMTVLLAFSLGFAHFAKLFGEFWEVAASLNKKFLLGLKEKILTAQELEFTTIQ